MIGHSSSRRNRAKPTKKLTINFTPPPAPPPSYRDSTWTKLQSAISAIHHRRPTPHSLEELYTDVKSLCSNHHSSFLCEKLREEIDKHVGGELEGLVKGEGGGRRGEGGGEGVFLEKLCKVWEDHCEQMKMIRSIFLYLDRTYILSLSTAPSSGTPSPSSPSSPSPPRSIWALGVDLFQEHFLNFGLWKGTVGGVVGLIKQEREGDTVSRSLIQTITSMLGSLDLYSTHFEHVFLNETEEFYGREGEEKSEGMEVGAYLAHVNKRLNEEKERLDYYLDISTKSRLIQIIYKKLLFCHINRLLMRGFDNLMKGNKIEDLSLMYKLFSYVNGKEKMAQYLKDYVKGAGAELVTDKERDTTMVQNVLELKKKLDVIHTTAFDKNELFWSSIRDGLEHFLNIRGDRTSELVAKFVDSKLRASAAKSYSDSELENLLNDVLSIFRHINGKDVFEAFYKNDLSKRLLLGRSASIDAEKLMISKLRNECGSAFTAQMESMFKDVDVSKDIMESFRQSKVGQSVLGEVDLSVHVLTMSCWPPATDMEPNLPVTMGGYLETFRNFYLDKHSSRRLTWQHSLGHCILKVNFPKGKKELSVSLFQALVMLLFNEKDVFNFLEIKEKTNLEDKELRRTLQSLACAKIRVLGKKPMTREVNDEDKFCINQNFKQQLFRIKINQIQAKETKEEVAKTNQAVFMDRQYQVDATVVRIMKTRKTLSHNLLVAELYKQLKFPLEQSVIKKRIESLIDREFIEEDEENSSVYTYVA